jgi:metallo-beta-lactamase family protein
MPTSLTFLGATQTVTGSKFLLERAGRGLLLDCGLYQGERRLRRMNWDPVPVDVDSLDDVVLTHAHLDHCGYLPALAKGGYAGPVWSTWATAALAAIVLRDSAHLQEEEAQEAEAGQWSRHHPPRPLYDTDDAERAIRLFRTRSFDEPVTLSNGLTLTFGRAGHILGSATALLDAGDGAVLFSGDLGRPDHPLLVPRSRPPAARTVVLESTYGDRVHPRPTGEPHAALAEAVRRAVARGGSVLIPAFAVDRTELVLLALAELRSAGAIPDVPVHVDSPMALTALDVYADARSGAELRGTGLGRLDSLGTIDLARTAQEMRLNNPGRPCIIVSASGMATGGRVVHHLEQMLGDPRHAVVLTGYQAVGTRGRSLLEGAREIKMRGRYVRVRAEVVIDEEFSTHADAEELLGWLKEMPEVPETVYLIHGEVEASAALADRIRGDLDCAVVVPRPGERVLLD